MSAAKNLTAFRELISSIPNFYHWIYEDGSLIDGNAPAAQAFYRDILLRSRLFDLVPPQEDNLSPAIVSNNVGLHWFILALPDAPARLRHVLGPVFTAPGQPEQMKASLDTWQPHLVTTARRNQLSSYFQLLPVMSTTELGHYGSMLCYFLTGKNLPLRDIAFPRRALGETCEDIISLEDRQDHYQAQQQLLHHIRNGQTAPADCQNRIMELIHHGHDLLGSSLDKTKMSAYLFTGHCAGAAVAGGLSPDRAYAIEDRYLRRIQESLSMPDLPNLLHDMYQEFLSDVRLVQNRRTVSVETRRCIDYIDLHTDRSLDIDSLAGMLGYAPYYLSRKFTREMGVSLPDYIKHARIERAKLLLRTSDQSVADIARAVGIKSQSHFSATFRNIAGCSPREYRQRRQTDAAPPATVSAPHATPAKTAAPARE